MFTCVLYLLIETFLLCNYSKRGSFWRRSGLLRRSRAPAPLRRVHNQPLSFLCRTAPHVLAIPLPKHDARLQSLLHGQPRSHSSDGQHVDDRNATAPATTLLQLTAEPAASKQDAAAVLCGHATAPLARTSALSRTSSSSAAVTTATTAAVSLPETGLR